MAKPVLKLEANADNTSQFSTTTSIVPLETFYAKEPAKYSAYRTVKATGDKRALSHDASSKNDTTLHSFTGFMETNLKPVSDAELFETLREQAAKKSKEREKDIRIIRETKSRMVIDMLAQTWLRNKKWDLDTKSYIIYKIMPVLVLGLVKVLKKAAKRGLIEESLEDPDYNPIDDLARYLLRHNPRYSPFNETHPYVHGLRMVSLHLRQEMDDYAENNLARVKKEAFERRTLCETVVAEELKEEERRIRVLKQIFMSWNDGRRVSISLAQNALLSFEERVKVMGYPEDSQLSVPIEVTSQQGVNLLMERFVQYMLPIVSTLSNEMFDVFNKHMEFFGVDFKNISRVNDVKYELEQLFKTCNTLKLGYLYKAKVVESLKSLYERLNKFDKEKVRSPYEWPITETGDYTPEEDDASQIKTSVEKVKEGHKSDEEKKDEKEESSPPKMKHNKHVYIDFDQPLMPPPDSINTVCPPDRSSKKFLQTPMDVNKPYPEFFADKNVKYAILDYQRLKGVEEQVKTATVTIAKNVMFTNMPIVDLYEEETPYENFMEKLELANSTDLLSMWKLKRINRLDKNEELINVEQFCHLLINFLDRGIFNQELVNMLSLYVLEACKMGDEEKMETIQKFKKTWEEERLDRKPGELFENWDSNGSGFLSFEQILNKIRATKIFTETFINLNVVKYHQDTYGQSDKVTKANFKKLLSILLNNLPANCDVDNLFTKLIAQNFHKRSYNGEERRRSLHRILFKAELNPHCMYPVFKEAISVLRSEKNEMSHERSFSATISFLEKVAPREVKDEYCLLKLHYKSEDKKEAHLGSYMSYLPDSLSYHVVKTKEIMVLRNTNTHPNIIADMWDRHLREEIGEGQLVLCPILDIKNRVMGVFAVDSLPPISSHQNAPVFAYSKGKDYLDKRFIDETLPIQKSMEVLVRSMRAQKAKHKLSVTTMHLLSFRMDRSMVELVEVDKTDEDTVSNSSLEYMDDFPDSEKSEFLKSTAPYQRNLVSDRVLKKIVLKDDKVYISDDKIDFIQGICKALSITLMQHLHFSKMQSAFQVIMDSIEHFSASTLWCAIYRVGYDVGNQDHFLQEMMTYQKQRKKHRERIKTRPRSDGSGHIYKKKESLRSKFIVRSKASSHSQTSSKRSIKITLPKNLNVSSNKGNSIRNGSSKFFLAVPKASSKAESGFKSKVQSGFSSSSHFFSNGKKRSIPVSKRSISTFPNSKYTQASKYTSHRLITSSTRAQEAKYELNTPVKVNRKQLPFLGRLYNLYRPMLFACMDSGQPKYGKCLGNYFYAFPIKDPDLQTKFVLYFNLGAKKISKIELQNLLFYQHVCTKSLHYVINEEEKDDEPTEVIQNVVCKICLEEIADKLVKKLSGKEWNTFINLPSIPSTVKKILLPVMLLLYPEIFSLVPHNWDNIRAYLNTTLATKILKFDPNKCLLTKRELIFHKNVIEAIPRRVLSTTNYEAVIYFYEWALFSLATVLQIRERNEKDREKMSIHDMVSI